MCHARAPTRASFFYQSSLRLKFLIDTVGSMAYTCIEEYPMEPSQVIKKLLPAFQQYYTIKENDVTPPFCAEAEFRSHNEQYFLVRSAHIADIDSNEFVYFAALSDLDEAKLEELVTSAWQNGLSRVQPHEGHRNSDVTLLIFADRITDETKIKIKKTKLYKSYKFSFHGWSNFKLAAADLSSTEKDGTPEVFSNRHGKDYVKLIKKNIKNPS